MSDIRPTDDHPEGGRYIDQNDFWVNAEGQFIDQHGNVVEKPVKANAPKPDSRPALDKDGNPAAPVAAPAPAKPADMTSQKFAVKG